MAIASSSKRPLPTTTSATPHKKPRQRQSYTPSTTSVHPDDDLDEGEEDEIIPVDETAKEKKARKDARTIRNRESAQRSRNQRKAHLAWLEIRVEELEKENKTLRSSGSTSTTPPTSPPLLKTLPRLSPIPTSLLSTSIPGGINLASVAPPPTDLVLSEDIKPIIPVGGMTTMDQLLLDNTALRHRVESLEGLIKQVLALNSGPLPPVESVPQPINGDGKMDDPLDWDSIFTSTSTSDSTTTPPQTIVYSTTLYTAPPSTINHTQSTEFNESTGSTGSQLDLSSNLNSSLARHPAAVATPSTPSTTRDTESEGSLQRARISTSMTKISISDSMDSTDSTGLINLGMTKIPITQERINGVVKVLILLAKLKGWIPLVDQENSVMPVQRDLMSHQWVR